MGFGTTYALSYYKLYTLKINNQNYYLAVYYGIFSGKGLSQGIRIFAINYGKLEDARLIKTHSGLSSKLYYYNNGYSANGKAGGDIIYDATLKKITLPVVLDGGKLSCNRIIYKYSGRYFERIKN